MTELPTTLQEKVRNQEEDVTDFTSQVQGLLEKAGYTIAEINGQKPWGAYIRIANEQADSFIEDFFPDLTPEEARMGNQEAEVSPKILIVKPGQRLSLQTHARRAERWKFLTQGRYVKGESEDTAHEYEAQPGDVVQFQKGDLHRLCGVDTEFVVVAEIWQHTDPSQLSNEDDIVRLSDDYSR